MKALACGACGDIQALDTQWRSCKCRNVQARWTDPVAGKAEFRAAEKTLAFLLGLNNRVLGPALRGELAMFEDFRAAHDAATKAPYHVFDESRGNCWAVVVQMGTTSDVRWSEIEVGDRVRERRRPIVQGVVEALEEAYEDTIATVALGAGDLREFQVNDLEKV